MSTIDLHNKDTEQDFHALTKGLFEAAVDNDYLPLYRRLIKHKGWGPKVKPYIKVRGKAVLHLTNTGVEGRLRQIAADAADTTPGEFYTSDLEVAVPFEAVIEMNPLYVGHNDDVNTCAPPLNMTHEAKRVVAARIREHMDQYHVSGVTMDADTIVSACGHPLCTQSI